jgi:hypothetical protein
MGIFYVRVWLYILSNPLKVGCRLCQALVSATLVSLNPYIEHDAYVELCCAEQMEV